MMTLTLPSVGPLGTARAATIGDNVRTASNVGPFLPQIQQNVAAQAQVLAGKDAIAQSKARNELISDATREPTPSPAFLNAFAQALNTELLKLAQSPDARTRLNAAIVAARLAEAAAKDPASRAGGASLVPLTQALLNDKSDGVVLWGLKAARFVLPAAIAAKTPGADQLAATIVKIGQARPSVVGDVYDALAISLAPGTDPKPVLGITVPSLHAVLKSRANIYQRSIPQDATAEVRAATYLTSKDVYTRQPEAQVTTMQLLSDLLGVAAQRAGDVTPEQRKDLAYMIRGVGGAVHVVGMAGWETNRNLMEQTTAVRQLNLSATASEMAAAVEPVHPAIKAIQKFAGITPPPKIGEMQASSTTGPSTTPADGRGASAGDGGGAAR
jgi:hypothetical protein